MTYSVTRTSPSRQPRTAAFFDMDRTVLRIDSGMSWMRFLYRRGELSKPELMRAVYWSLLYKAAILDMESLATRLAADMRGSSEEAIVAKCVVWHAQDVCHQVAPAARVTIDRHRRRGDLVVLLTGATQYVAEAVSHGLAIEHTLCSRLEVADGVFTGRLAELCFGHYKVAVAEQFAATHNIALHDSVFYSDSYNDLPMLERVGTAVAVNPDARLHHHARRAGWRIDRWA